MIFNLTPAERGETLIALTEAWKVPPGSTDPQHVAKAAMAEAVAYHISGDTDWDLEDLLHLAYDIQFAAVAAMRQHGAKYAVYDLDALTARCDDPTLARLAFQLDGASARQREDGSVVWTDAPPDSRDFCATVDFSRLSCAV